MAEKARNIFKIIKKQREQEFIPPNDPSQSYYRTFDKTRMSWPIALLYKGRIDILALIVILIVFMAICVIAFLYIFILPALKYLLEVLF